MIRLGGHTIALSTSCALECTLNTLDARTKENYGAPVEVADYISWNISCESLLGLNQGTEQHTYATLMDLFLAKQRVEVEVMLADTLASDWTASMSPLSAGIRPYAGEALIKSLSLTGDATGKAKIRIQLSGQGALQPLSVAPTLHLGFYSPDGTVQATDVTAYTDEITKSCILLLKDGYLFVRGIMTTRDGTVSAVTLRTPQVEAPGGGITARYIISKDGNPISEYELPNIIKEYNILTL